MGFSGCHHSLFASALGFNGVALGVVILSLIDVVGGLLR